jgi:hypothetical protein
MVAPLPLPLLGSWRQGYAWSQPVVTRVSSRLPVSALDVLIVGVLLTAGWLAWSRRGRWRLLPTAVALAGVAALLWLLFLALWGWHYQVPTLESRLSLTPADLSAARGEAFARATVRQINQLHGDAHASGWPTRAELPAIIGPRLAAVLPALGVTHVPVLPVPRQTMLDGYFRAAGIDGMTNPFGLEILLNSRVLPVELPALVAHEYAHLAGFADESDASVVAWLACQSGKPALRYSGALAVLPHVLAGLPRDRQRDVIKELADGPRQDLTAIRRRLSEQRPWVHAVAWQSYDRFLRANRVSEGVARYDAVARVLIGAADPVSGSLLRRPQSWPSQPGR